MYLAYKRRYAHLSKILVKAGQKVGRGNIIGLSGLSADALVADQSGLATGPHLHFELYQDGKPIDPERMLRQM